MRQIWLQYSEWKEERNLLDFNDILVETYALLRRDKSALNSLQKRFRYVLVDEWQDTNRIQASIVKWLAKPEDNLFVVGDDDQTIYAFNGADNRMILQFHKVYPGVKAVQLDVNYRSGHEIVGLGNQIIRHNVHRKVKELKSVAKGSDAVRYLSPADTDAEANEVLGEIGKFIASGRTYSDIAVLCRTHASSRAVVDALVLNHIPFVADARRLFYDHALIQPLISYLRLCCDPQNVDAVEMVLPSLYVPRESIHWIQAQQASHPKPVALDNVLDLPNLAPFQRRKIQARIQLLRKVANQPPADIVTALRDEYEAYLTERNGDSLTAFKESQREMLDEFVDALKRFKTTVSFLQFLEDLHAKYEGIKEQNGQNQEAVSVLTVHQSKGLEFPIVFVIGMSEGIMPHACSLAAEPMKDVVQGGHAATPEALLEEERRLAYVAVTRARSQLFISSPQRYRGKSAFISRFLLEAHGEPHPYGRDSSAVGRKASRRSYQKLQKAQKAL